MKVIKKRKYYKAVSIIEMLITMGLFGLLSVVILQSLFLNIKLSTQINIRARVRSDLDEMQTMIERDIRNAEEILVNSCYDRFCIMKVNGNYVRWQTHAEYVYPSYKFYVKRYEAPNLTDWVLTYKSPSTLYVDHYLGLNFDVLYFNSDPEGDISYYQKFVNVVVTIVAESNVDAFKCQQDVNLDGCRNGTSDIQWVDDQIRQFSVSTRNYLIE